MLRLAFLAFLIFSAGFALLVASIPSPPPPQPIQFSHKVHLDYFQDGRHRDEMISIHEEILDDYKKDGSHGQSMIAMHHDTLMTALEDEEIVGEMIVDIKKGICTQCHGDFDRNVKDYVRLEHCAECHRRKEEANEEFLAGMKVDIEKGRCALCHGSFDRNAQNLTKLGHCAECHRAFVGREWEEARRDQRPCMGCHSGVFDSPMASIPNSSTCAACHQPPLEGDHREPELAKFIEQERTIPWARVYDYLPGDIVFSHERHAELGLVRCQECHGFVEQSERPLFLEVKLSMEDCMDCHERDREERERRGEVSWASNDCLACHR